MSKSYKKAYVYMGCFKSLASWRSSYNRRFRRMENRQINQDPDYICYKNPYKLFYADVWCGPSDGHSYYLNPDRYALDSAWTSRHFCKFRKKRHALLHK